VNRDASEWVSPLVAVLVLAVVSAQIIGALRVTGAFGWRTPAPRVTISPAYESLDRAIDRHDPNFTPEGMRDPFEYGRAEVASHGNGAPARPRPKPVPVAVPALPVLTAIVWDNDPRALVRWKEREWTVREGGLFDEFQVVAITRNQITLRHGDETLVLNRRTPGD
jgi:hypothetical protein